MAERNMQVHGIKRRNYDFEQVQPDGSQNSPNMMAKLEYTLHRNSASDAYVTLSVKGTLYPLFTDSSLASNSRDPVTLNWKDYSWTSTNTSDYSYQYWSSVTFRTVVDWSTGREENVEQELWDKPNTSYGQTIGTWSKWTDYVSDGWRSWTFYWPSNNPVTFDEYIYGGCYTYDTSHCPAGDYYISSSIYADTEYNPYSPPSTYVVTPPAIMRIDTTYRPQVDIVLGTGGKLHWIKYEVYPNSTTWNYGKWDDVKNAIESQRVGLKEVYRDDTTSRTSISQAFDFKPSECNCTDGNTYRLAIRFSDCKYEWISGDDKVIRTYRKPTMSTSVTANPTSPQNGAQLKWQTNERAHSTYENSFTTVGIINNHTISNISQATSGAYTLNDSFLNTYFTAAERSVASMSGSYKFTRENTSAQVGTSKYIAESTGTFTIQYQPNKKPTGGNVTNTSGANVKGQTIVAQDTQRINVDWAYPYTTNASGVVNGYKLQVCTSSDGSGSYGSVKTVNVSTPGSSGTIQLNTLTDLKRGVMNYVKITPFYTKPNGSGTIDGTQYLVVQLVKPISKLNAPTIDYPINNTTWHNRYFRVLVQLPVDDDLQNLIDDGTIANADAYRYEDIEIKVAYSTGGNVVYKTNTTAIWSKTISNIKHNEKIAICPALSTLSDVASYTVSVRVRKKYYSLTEAQSWSDYTTVIVKNTAVSTLSLSAGQEIKASHYKTIRDASVRCHSVYPIQNLDSNNIDQNAGDQIDRSEYQGIYNTILGIKNGVNGYCTYDNTNVSFTRTINDLTNNPPKVEYVTADKTPSDVNGRNYINILIDDLNQLY